MALSAEAVVAVIAARTETHRVSEEARRLREATFPAGLLAGTGSEAWAALWESARRFSQDSAYPSQAFPVVENDARCVLCQQDLDHAAARLVDGFGGSSEIEMLAEQIDARVKTLRDSATDENRRRMTAEAQELSARKMLAKYEQTILDDIERRKRYAAYSLCIDETKTQAITQKSTAITKTAVSQKLKTSSRTSS